MITITMVYENEAWEIARRVLKSYPNAKEPEDEQVADLGHRIHKAAADINNEKVKEAIAGSAPSPSAPVTYYPGS